MSAATYWNLVILFCVLCQGIIGTLSENDIDESTEHVRQKRVINRLPGGDKREKIKDYPYVVSIRGFRSNDSCVGVILSEHVVLTAFKCVSYSNVRYKVYSGNAQAVMGYGSTTTHNIINKKFHRFNYRFRDEDGLALVTVSPPFQYSLNTNKVELYQGPVPHGLHGTVVGWGCNPMGEPETAHPSFLRTIYVPIISLHDCQVHYRNTFPISPGDICTLDGSQHQYCGVDDAGAPLLIQTDYKKYLLGIHLWNGGVIGRSNPDVFVDLQFPTYKHWILETIPILEASVHHH